MATGNPSALLDWLMQHQEGLWLEFKANNEDPDRIGRTVSACANAAMLAESSKAFIVWGIHDKTKKRIGTHIKLSALKKGNENLMNWLSRMLEPRIMLEPIDFQAEGKSFSILVIEPTYDRPVEFAGVKYIRIGENVKPLHDFPTHERSLWLATSRRKFEQAIASSHCSGDRVLELLDAKTYFELSEKPLPKNDAEILRCLQQFGCLNDDMEGGYDITNLGALLLAKDVSNFLSVASKAVRVIKYSGLDKSKATEEQTGKMGYAVGFKGLLYYIMKNLPKEDKYPGGVRRNAPLYSHTAIREILANALVHQDLTVSGVGPVVEIYDNRIEISNPGSSAVPIDRIIDERQSRNERLALLMRELGICEERGGGIDKAILDIEANVLPTPYFHSSENSMKVVIFGPKPFAKLSKRERVWACFCHCVVQWVKQDFMTNASLRKRFGLSDEEYQPATDAIAEAKAAKRIVVADPGQGRRYAKYVPYFAGKL